MLRCRWPFVIIVTLCIGQVVPQATINPCEGVCEIPLSQTCEIAAALYDFSGDCCALTTNENGTCTLVSSSECDQEGRVITCTSTGPDDIACDSPLVVKHVSNNTDGECPFSELDVVSRPPSNHSQVPGLLMTLTGITDIADENKTRWQDITSEHIISYYGSLDKSSIADVLGYVELTSLTPGDTDVVIMYMQVTTYRPSLSTGGRRGEDSKTIDEKSLVESPFTEDAIAYLKALNAAGILATEVSVEFPSNRNDTDTPDTNTTEVPEDTTNTTEAPEETEAPTATEPGTESPEVKTTKPPKVKATKAPEVKATEAPEASATKAPQKNSTSEDKGHIENKPPHPSTAERKGTVLSTVLVILIGIML